MKTIKSIFMICIVCCIFSACTALDNLQPEISEKDKEFCISAIEFFVENANKLNGEKLKMFTNNIELMMTHEAALERYGEKMDNTTRNAYWAVVIVNDLLPKNYELVDTQLQKMKIDINKADMRGFIDSNVFIKGTLSFKDNKTESKNIEICMHAEKDIAGTGIIPKISYIKFVD